MCDVYEYWNRILYIGNLYCSWAGDYFWHGTTPGPWHRHSTTEPLRLHNVRGSKISHTGDTCVTCRWRHDCEINHSCVSPSMGCFLSTFLCPLLFQDLWSLSVPPFYCTIDPDLYNVFNFPSSFFSQLIYQYNIYIMAIPIVSRVLAHVFPLECWLFKISMHVVSIAYCTDMDFSAVMSTRSSTLLLVPILWYHTHIIRVVSIRIE